MKAITKKFIKLARRHSKRASRIQALNTFYKLKRFKLPNLKSLGVNAFNMPLINLVTEDFPQLTELPGEREFLSRE